MKDKFENIWNKFYEHLSGFVENRIYDIELKDDCLQEIFIKINNGLPSLKDDNKLESWIFQIARNTIIDFNRQKEKQKSAQITRQDLEIEINDSKNIEIAECIVPFIKQLPLKYSEPLMLYEIEGLSQKEISGKENISLSGAKSRIQRGRIKLKNALNECCKFELDKRGNILDYRTKQNDCNKC